MLPEVPGTPSLVKGLFLCAVAYAGRVDVLLQLAPSARAMVHSGLEWAHLDPVVLLLVGLVQAMAFHAPSLWSQHAVHRGQCLTLFEHIVFLFVAHVLALTVVDGVSARLQRSDLAWPVAGYLALHYAWHVYAAARIFGEGTLSPALLRASVGVYGAAVVPAVLSAAEARLGLASALAAVLAADAARWAAGALVLATR